MCCTLFGLCINCYKRLLNWFHKLGMSYPSLSSFTIKSLVFTLSFMYSHSFATLVKTIHLKETKSYKDWDQINQIKKKKLNSRKRYKTDSDGKKINKI